MCPTTQVVAVFAYKVSAISNYRVSAYLLSVMNSSRQDYNWWSWTEPASKGKVQHKYLAHTTAWWHCGSDTLDLKHKALCHKSQSRYLRIQQDLQWAQHEKQQSSCDLLEKQGHTMKQLSTESPEYISNSMLHSHPFHSADYPEIWLNHLRIRWTSDFG